MTAAEYGRVSSLPSYTEYCIADTKKIHQLEAIITSAFGELYLLQDRGPSSHCSLHVCQISNTWTAANAAPSQITILKRWVCEKKQSHDQLKTAITEQLDALLSEGIVQKLCDSMPDHLVAVVNARGKAMSYISLLWFFSIGHGSITLMLKAN